jgi:hypothetical protein
MKRSYLIAVLVLFLSSFSYSQGKTSIQLTGGEVHPISSSPGLSGALQYNYNINPRFNLFVSADYSYWDERNFSYIKRIDNKDVPATGYIETDHELSRIMAGGRYLITQGEQLKLFVEAGIGYSYLHYYGYDIELTNNPDGSTEISNPPAYRAHQNLFNFSTGIGFIHPITKRCDILFEFKLNTFMNNQYSGLFGYQSTFSSFHFGFNYKV